MEEQGLKITGKKTEYLSCDEHQGMGKGVDVKIAGIDVGGWWRTGCGSHPHSAEWMEELEESVWRDMRQKNESEDQRKMRTEQW